ncbi:MAG: complex I subunit 5 family protein [Persicimonas sp.]
MSLDILPEIDGLLLAAVLFPLLWASALAIESFRRTLLELAPLAGLPALVVALLGPPDHLEVYDGLLLGSRFVLDDLGGLFLAVVAFVWILAGFFSRGREPKRRRGVRYFVFFLLTMSGNLGVVVARDLPGFLFFFSLMGLSSYGLVAHRQTPEALRAAKIYMAFLILGEALLYAGSVWAATDAGSLSVESIARAIDASPNRGAIAALIVSGFGIKAGFVPLHVSLPPAYRAAPEPAAAVLSGAMTKAALLGWMLFLPAGISTVAPLGHIFVFGGIVAIYYGVLVGLFQESAKAMLAYSSISQIGFMTLIIGFGLLEPQLWPSAKVAVAIYALHHALNESALFLGVRVARDVRPDTAWLVKLGLILPALALAGAPLSSGAVAKHALKGVVESAASAGAQWLVALVSLGAVGTAVLMVRFLYAVWPSSRREHPIARPGLEARRWVPWALLVIAATFSVWMLWWYPLEAASGEVLKWSAVASQMWPLGVAAALVMAVVAARDRLRWIVDRRIPTGDLLVPILAAWWWLLRRADWVAGKCSGCWRWIVAQLTATLERRSGPIQRMRRLEAVLSRWHVGATLLMLTAATLFALLWWF